MKLTQKQKLFAEYYLKSGNATQSYIDAGYSCTTRVVAEANAKRLLRNDSVKIYITEKNKEIESDNIADMIEVKEFWSSLMRDEKSENRDRLKASEYIAKTNGAFLDKVEHTGNIPVTIVDDIK